MYKLATAGKTHPVCSRFGEWVEYSLLPIVNVATWGLQSVHLISRDFNITLLKGL